MLPPPLLLPKYLHTHFAKLGSFLFNFTSVFFYLKLILIKYSLQACFFFKLQQCIPSNVYINIYIHYTYTVNIHTLFQEHFLLYLIRILSVTHMQSQNSSYWVVDIFQALHSSSTSSQKGCIYLLARGEGIPLSQSKPRSFIIIIPTCF